MLLEPSGDELAAVMKFAVANTGLLVDDLDDRLVKLLGEDEVAFMSGMPCFENTEDALAFRVGGLAGIERRIAM
jgi:hypothetical protein